MSKEPSNRRFATGTATPEPGVPYRKLPDAAGGNLNRGGHSSAPAAASTAIVAASDGQMQGPPRLTINNFATFHARVKKLPPDANIKAAMNTKLWQFPEQVIFGCAKCRRDKIQSDSVAIDQRNKIILCTSCFTRIVRPRTYKPSRVVPFPSLLSWLNYKPSKVMDVSEDVMARPAEAVAPSGNRMALPMLASGDRPTSLEKLPAIGMRIVPSNTTSSVTGASTANSGDALGLGTHGGAADNKHPCLRIWGVCQHGETCLFRNAPADLCLAYLMGLCRGDHSDGNKGRGNEEEEKKKMTPNTGGTSERRRGRHCHLLHQKIYDLPHSSDPRPEARYVGEIEGEEELDDDAEESPWIRWIARRRKSPNSAEWQLWNNGALKTIFDVYVPAVERPAKEKPRKVQEEQQKPQSNEEDHSEVKLNLRDIMSALKGIKKGETE